jgi:peroxidase
LEFRTIDGSGNHPAEPDLNAAGSPFARLGPARFADGVSAMVDGPNSRTISNLVVGEDEAAVANEQGLSGMMYAWGQFIDHDLTRTASDGVTRIDVAVPTGDPHFADGSVLPMTRTVTDPTSGTGLGNPAMAID